MMNSNQQDATELANLSAKVRIDKASMTINDAETPWLDFSDINAADELVLCYEKEHRYEEACQIYCNLIRIRSSRFQPYKEIQPLKKRWMETCNTTKDQGLIDKINFHLAIISLQEEDKQAAIEHLNSFIKNNNEHIQARYLHATISSEIVNSLNETQKAQILENFEYAIKGSPEKLNYLRGKINFCLSQKQYNIAIEDTKRLNQEMMKTTDDTGLIRWCFKRLVDIYDTGNMVSEAIDYYNEETNTLKKNILFAPLRELAQKKLATITNDNPCIRKENIMLAMRLYNFLGLSSLIQANSLLLSIKEISSAEEKITLLKEFILQMKKFNKIIKLQQEDSYLENIIREAEDCQKKLNGQPSDGKQEDNDKASAEIQQTIDGLTSAIEKNPTDINHRQDRIISCIAALTQTQFDYYIPRTVDKDHRWNNEYQALFMKDLDVLIDHYVANNQLEDALAYRQTAPFFKTKYPKGSELLACYDRTLTDRAYDKVHSITSKKGTENEAHIKFVMCALNRTGGDRQLNKDYVYWLFSAIKTLESNEKQLNFLQQYLDKKTRLGKLLAAAPDKIAMKIHGHLADLKKKVEKEKIAAEKEKIAAEKARAIAIRQSSITIFSPKLAYQTELAHFRRIVALLTDPENGLNLEDADRHSITLLSKQTCWSDIKNKAPWLFNRAESPLVEEFARTLLEDESQLEVFDDNALLLAFEAALENEITSAKKTQDHALKSSTLRRV